MTAQRNTANKLPTGLFDDTAFRTLYGGAMITWVSTNAICHAFGELDRELTGLGVAMTVALVAFLLGERLNVRKILIVPFNGLLIYLTVVGGTSFLPDPVPYQNLSPSAATSEGAARDSQNTVEPAGTSYSFFTKWNSNKNLIRQNAALSTEKEHLRNQNYLLLKAKRAYERRFDSTRTAIQSIDIPLKVKQQLLHKLSLGSFTREQAQLQPR